MILEWLCTSSASRVNKAQQRRNTFSRACMTVHSKGHSQPRLATDYHFKPFKMYSFDYDTDYDRDIQETNRIEFLKYLDGLTDIIDHYITRSRIDYSR